MCFVDIIQLDRASVDMGVGVLGVAERGGWRLCDDGKCLGGVKM